MHFDVPVTSPGAEDALAVRLLRAVRDDGAGNLAPLGWPINYATGELHFNADLMTVTAIKMFAPKAVSYTHLDVYKRQGQQRVSRAVQDDQHEGAGHAVH